MFFFLKLQPSTDIVVVDSGVLFVCFSSFNLPQNADRCICYGSRTTAGYLKFSSQSFHPIFSNTRLLKIFRHLVVFLRYLFYTETDRN